MTRIIASYDWEDGSSLRAVVNGEVSTATVLDMLENLISAKRAELEAIERAADHLEATHE